jgi:hypothetical protein
VRLANIDPVVEELVQEALVDRLAALPRDADVTQDFVR